MRKFLFLSLMMGLAACAKPNPDLLTVEKKITSEEAVVVMHIADGFMTLWKNTKTKDQRTINRSDDIAVFTVPAGTYTLAGMVVDGGFMVQGGLHPITNKHLYAGFDVAAGEAIYIGDFHLDTDACCYYRPSTSTDPLANLITNVVASAILPSFEEDDGLITLENKYSEAKAYYDAHYAHLNRPLIERPATLGYYALDNDEGDEDKGNSDKD